MAKNTTKTPATSTKSTTATKTPPTPKKVATSSTPAPSTNGTANQLGRPATKILRVLAKKAMTRAEISAATGINSGFTSLLGHLEPEKREAQSLAARGFIKPETSASGQNGEAKVVTWSITAAGRKALEKAPKE